MARHILEINENVTLSDSATARIESDYLIISNKQRCAEIINESSDNNLSQEQAIDFLIALHLVLEVGLNTFFRHISLTGIRKRIHPIEITKNLDQISFIDKTVLFIYNSSFNFDDCLDEATSFHAVIGKIKDFSGARNKLLHGHSISTVHDASGSRDSEAKSLIGSAQIARQIENFRFIMKGLSFYFDRLETGITQDGKANYKSQYLNADFLSGFAQDS